MSHFEFLCFFSFFFFFFFLNHNLRFWVFHNDFLSFITIWVFDFHHNLSFWISSQFEFLSFITIWVFNFPHNLIFCVSLQFELSSFIKFWVIEFYPNLIFEFYHILSFWMFCWINLVLVKKKIFFLTIFFFPLKFFFTKNSKCDKTQ